MRSTTVGANFGVRYMGPHVFDGEATQGGTHRAIVIGDREEVKAAAGRSLAEVRGEKCSTGVRETTVENVH